MANEFSVATATGQTLYVLLRNAAGQVYRTTSTAFEAYNAANYSSYALALSEQGSTGYYLGSMPQAVSVAGRYSVQAKAQATGAPLLSDANVGSGAVLWSGTAELDAYALPSVTVGGYSSGQDPATLILAAPANKLLTNGSGQVQADLAQSVPTSNTPQTVGDALNGARAQAFGKWSLVGTTLNLFAADGTTIVRSFSLDSARSPTQRA